jgi:hypothetical protein
MADEFAKGFGILVTAGLGWMILAGWYNTPNFTEQFSGASPNPETLGTYAQLALALKDVLFWFAILGAITFWIVIPAFEQARNALAE